MDALTFLDKIDKAKVQPIYVLTGDEAFLKHQVLAGLRRLVLGPGDDGFGVCTFAGDKASFSVVHAELTTLPFLAPRRLVVVERADPFITAERSRLEKYAAAPAEMGVLVLDVQMWQSNTRLAKQLPDVAVLVCKSPQTHKLPEWCVAWCKAQHGKELPLAAARLLVDLVGPDMGLLNQELSKLATYVGDARRIDSGVVDLLVGSSRAENAWRIFDLIGNGQTGEALTFLARLFEQGEDPMRLLGAFSMQLRRLAQVWRLHSQGQSLDAAQEDAGVPPFVRRNMEQHLRRLGQRRLNSLYDWLIETDLGMKGSSQLPPRTLLERLVVQLVTRQTSIDG
jgi:DNA polymerase III subunit delta